MIVRVWPENVTPLWPQVSELLDKALAIRPTHSTEDVRLMCMSGVAHLWVQYDKPVVQAAIITEFAVYPRGVWLRIWLDGARKDAKQDHAAFFEELEKWRTVNGCAGIEAGGRYGWARVFSQLGIGKVVVEGVNMRWTKES